YAQNNAGSLSRWSSESHATDRPAAAATVSHSASSVVLPNPAGADTRVSADSAPRLRRSLSLERATRLRRHLGTWSLVSSSGPAMTTAPQEAHTSSGHVVTPDAECRRRVHRAGACWHRAGIRNHGQRP